MRRGGIVRHSRNFHSTCADAALTTALLYAAGISDSVLHLIDVTPPSSLVEHGVYIRPAASISPDSFGKGRVVIMGDASHPMRPIGQGYNQTVEDAYFLARALADSSSAAEDVDLEVLQVRACVACRRV